MVKRQLQQPRANKSKASKGSDPLMIKVWVIPPNLDQPECWPKVREIYSG